MIVDLIVIICIFFFIKSIYDKEKSNYVLLKILGYKNYEIINISFGKTIIYYIISFILLTLILIIFKLFLVQTNLGNIRLYLLNLRILKFKQIVYTNFLLICLNNIFISFGFFSTNLIDLYFILTLTYFIHEDGFFITSFNNCKTNLVLFFNKIKVL